MCSHLRDLQIAPYRPAQINLARFYASVSEPDLKSTLREAIPAKRELLKKVKSHGNKVIGEIKVENTIGGMRFARDQSSHGCLG